MRILKHSPLPQDLIELATRNMLLRMPDLEEEEQEMEEAVFAAEEDEEQERADGLHAALDGRPPAREGRPVTLGGVSEAVEEADGIRHSSQTEAECQPPTTRGTYYTALSPSGSFVARGPAQLQEGTAEERDADPATPAPSGREGGPSLRGEIHPAAAVDPVVGEPGGEIRLAGEAPWALITAVPPSPGLAVSSPDLALPPQSYAIMPYPPPWPYYPPYPPYPPQPPQPPPPQQTRQRQPKKITRSKALGELPARWHMLSETIFRLEDMVEETNEAIDEINLLSAIAADALKMRRAAKLQKKHWHQDIDQV